MAQDTNKMESYSKIVDAKLRANSVFAAIFNQRHDGAGASGAVKIPVRTEAVAGQYVTATGLAISNRCVVCHEESPPHTKRCGIQQM